MQTAATNEKKVRKSAKDGSPQLQSGHDHSAELKRVSRIKGQIEGVDRMIRDRRYCPEIVQQIKSIRAALRSLECAIIEGHLHHCVKQAIQSKDTYTAQEKLEEIVLLLKGQG